MLHATCPGRLGSAGAQGRARRIPGQSSQDPGVELAGSRGSALLPQTPSCPRSCCRLWPLVEKRGGREWDGGSPVLWCTFALELHRLVPPWSQDREQSTRSPGWARGRCSRGGPVRKTGVPLQPSQHRSISPKAGHQAGFAAQLENPWGLGQPPRHDGSPQSLLAAGGTGMLVPSPGCCGAVNPCKVGDVLW